MDNIHVLLTPEQRTGAEAELRFLKLCNSTQPPHGILKAWLAPAKWDALGIDCVVTVKRPGGKIVDVPVQVKSSNAGRESHYRNYNLYWLWRVPVVVVKRNLDDRFLRKEIEAEFRHVRLNHYNFSQVFRHLRNKYVSDDLVLFLTELRRVSGMNCPYGECLYLSVVSNGGGQGEVIRVDPERKPCGKCHQSLRIGDDLGTPPGYRRLTSKERGDG
jgi:hypothetical protein